MARIIDENILKDLGKAGNVSDQYLDAKINAIEQNFNTPELINKLFSGMISDSGLRLQLDRTAMYDSVCQGYSYFSGDDFDQMIEALRDAGLLNPAGGDRFELSSNSLAQQVLRRLESERRVLQKVETFIADRYEMNQESEYLLNEEELNYIDIYIKELDIPAEHKNFIQNSRDAIIRSRNRRRWIVTGIYLFISAAALAAIIFGIRALKSEKLARENADAAQRSAEEAKLASAQADSLKLVAQANAIKAFDQQIKAEVNASQADSLKLLAEANATKALEEQKKAEENATEADSLKQLAEKQRTKAEEQRKIAENQAKEIDQLNKDLETTNRELVITTIAKDLAQKSIAMGPKEKEIKALLAKSVYKIHKNSSKAGNIYDPTIVNALYDAVKTLEEEDDNPDFDRKRLGVGPLRQILFDKEGKGFYTTGGALPIGYKKIVKTNYPGVPDLFEAAKPDVGQFDSLNTLSPKVIYQTLAQTQDGRNLIMAGGNPYLKVYDEKKKESKSIYKLSEKFYNPNKVNIASSYQSTRPNEFLLGIDQRLFIISYLVKESTDNTSWSVTPMSDLMEMPSSEGQVINAIAYESEKAFIYGTNRGELFWNNSKKVFNSYFHAVSAMAFVELNNERHLVVGYINGLIRIFKPSNDPEIPYGKDYYDLSQHTAIISSLSISKNSQYLAVGSYDQKVTIWDMNKIFDPQYIPVAYDDFECWVTSMSFTPDGKTLMVGDQKGRLRFINLDPEIYAQRICEKLKELNREITKAEWEKYYEKRVDYEKVCD